MLIRLLICISQGYLIVGATSSSPIRSLEHLEVVYCGSLFLFPFNAVNCAINVAKSGTLLN